MRDSFQGTIDLLIVSGPGYLLFAALKRKSIVRLSSAPSHHPVASLRKLRRAPPTMTIMITVGSGIGRSAGDFGEPE